VHWLEPDTWKLPAQLIDYWTTILVGVVAIVGSIVGAIRYGLKPLHRLRSGEGQQESISLIFVQNDQHCHWSTAQLNKQLGTHLSGRWYVTNKSERNVVILKARLDQYPTGHAYLATRHPAKRDYFRTNYPILSCLMSEVEIYLTFFPPIGRGHEPIVGDVVFTDNFGNEHRVPSRFSYIGPDMPMRLEDDHE
jgi:hypothetical protein